jgi:hypothetical protein
MGSRANVENSFQNVVGSYCRRVRYGTVHDCTLSDLDYGLDYAIKIKLPS